MHLLGEPAITASLLSGRCGPCSFAATPSGITTTGLEANQRSASTQLNDSSLTPCFIVFYCYRVSDRGFGFEIQVWPIQLWPELSIRMRTRDNAYNTHDLIQRPNSGSAADSNRAATGSTGCAQPEAIETLFNIFPDIEPETPELNWQSRMGYRWRHNLPVFNRCMRA